LQLKVSKASLARLPVLTAYTGFADNNALSRMVNRTVEVDDKAWAKLHINSQNAPKVTEDDEAGTVRVQKQGKGSEKCV